VEQKTIPETGFLRLSQVLELIPISKSSWWQGVRTGHFPPPVKISPRCTAWRNEDILLLIRFITEQGKTTN
jgi:predicted DNA-binding transcriptional regulator AlpA